MYFKLHVLQVMAYIPLRSKGAGLGFGGGLSRCCSVLQVLKEIVMLVFLNRLVTFRIKGVE
jgi:hypothetical protein